MLEQIIKKLGFDPFDNESYAAFGDDNPNPFSVLTPEEVDFIMETALLQASA